MKPAFDSLEAAMAAQDAYMAGLPGWVQVWVTFMTFVLLSAVWFVGTRREARIALAVALLTGMFSLLVGYWFGWSRLWGIVHLLLWTPFLLWLWQRRPKPLDLHAFTLWIWTLMATMAVSLAFDAVDVVRYFSGDP